MPSKWLLVMFIIISSSSMKTSFPMDTVWLGGSKGTWVQFLLPCLSNSASLG